MTRFLGAVLAVLGTCSVIRAEEDKAVKAVLDKAIKALGGEEKLSKARMSRSKTRGTFTIGGNDNAFTGYGTISGLDHFRQGFESEFMGEKVMGVMVVAGNKGWRRFGDMKMEMDKEVLANEKRNFYLQTIPGTLLPLREKGFKVKAGGEQKVGGKPAVGLAVTGPDGKDFVLYFDKQSGFPVKLVAKVAGFDGQEVTQETTFTDYKDFKGLKRATRIQTKRGGEKFLEAELTEFEVLDKVDPKTFTEPK